MIASDRSAAVADVAKGKSFYIRVSEQEYDACLASAESAGLTVSEFIRRRVNGTQTFTIEPPPAPTATRKRRRP